MGNPIKVLSFIGIICIILFMSGDVLYAEIKIGPAITLSEEYNDNIFLEPEKTVEYITRVIPSIHLFSAGPRWDWDVTYAPQYLYFAKKTHTNDWIQYLNLFNRTTIAKKVFFMEVQNLYSRRSISVSTDYTKQSSFVNQTDGNTFTVNPYLVLKPGSLTTVTTGYRYINIWYKDPLAIDRINHIGYADILRETSPRSAVTGGFSHTQNENRIQDYRRNDLSLGWRYEYAENSTLFLTLGNSWFDFEQAGKYTKVFWDAGVNYTFATLNAFVETTRKYPDDPARVLKMQDVYVAGVRKQTERTTLGLSAGLSKFWDVRTDTIETERYTAGLDMSHMMSRTVKGILNLSFQRFNDKFAETYRKLYLTDLRFDKQLSETFTLSLDYRYTYSASPGIGRSNYTNNRVFLALTKTF